MKKLCRKIFALVLTIASINAFSSESSAGCIPTGKIIALKNDIENDMKQYQLEREKFLESTNQQLQLISEVQKCQEDDTILGIGCNDEIRKYNNQLRIKSIIKSRYEMMENVLQMKINSFNQMLTGKCNE